MNLKNLITGKRDLFAYSDFQKLISRSQFDRITTSFEWIAIFLG